MDWTSISSQPSQLSHEVQESPDYPLSKADIRPPDRMTARKSSRKVTPDLAQASDALVNEEEDHDANDVQIVTADEIAEREAQRQTACLATNAASRLQETLQINPEEVAWGYPSPKRQQNVEFDDFKLSWWPELERETTKQKERRERNVSQGLRATRRAEQRRLDGTCWRKSWSCRGRADVEREMIDAVSFFPYPAYQGLDWLGSVCAAVQGSKVHLWRLRDDALAPTPIEQLATFDTNDNAAVAADEKDYEELFACAWSVNTSTWPFAPILVVGGRRRMMHVFALHQNQRGEVALVRDRTMTGHGRAITDLKFSRSHPHLLVSASQDRTARLWDPTVPQGSDREVLKQLDADIQHAEATKYKGRRAKNKSKAEETAPLPANVVEGATRGERYLRPAVAGELLGVLATGGHSEGILSVDIHPRLPLIVTSSMDGKICIWSIPEALRGPTWPTSELYQHPTQVAHHVAPLLGPPIFSSAHVHAMWPDQVTWVSANSCHLISKAGRAASDGQPIPGKEIKLWIPCLLDTDIDAPRGYTGLDSGLPPNQPSAGAAFSSQTSYRPVPSPFRCDRRIDLDDENALCDTYALHRLPVTQAARADQEALNETVLFVPTANEPALYAFRPFAAPCNINGVSGTKSASRVEELSRLKESLRPPTKAEREVYDFEPRLRPSWVSPLFEDGRHTRLRALAVEPEGARWVVGVGDEGKIICWQRASDSR